MNSLKDYEPIIVATHQAKALRLLDIIKQWQKKRKRKNEKSIALRLKS